jgi:hypothetical protein
MSLCEVFGVRPGTGCSLGGRAGMGDGGLGPDVLVMLAPPCDVPLLMGCSTVVVPPGPVMVVVVVVVYQEDVSQYKLHAQRQGPHTVVVVVTMFPVPASRYVSLEIFSWLDRFCRECAGGGARVFCGGGGGVVATGTCGVGASWFHDSPPEARCGLLAKLGLALVLGSLLPYAESKLVSTVSLLGLCSLVSMVSCRVVSCLASCLWSCLVVSLSFSFEWKGFERRNFDFFLSSEESALFEGAIGCEVFAG